MFRNIIGFQDTFGKVAINGHSDKIIIWLIIGLITGDGFGIDNVGGFSVGGELVGLRNGIQYGIGLTTIIGLMSTDGIM